MKHLIPGVLLFLSCATQAQTQLVSESWGTLADGRNITRYTLINAKGARASFMPLGAAILAVEVPDGSGNRAGTARPGKSYCTAELMVSATGCGQLAASTRKRGALFVLHWTAPMATRACRGR